MPGIYFNPLKRVFLNLSGGTVTGTTVFTQGVSALYLSGGTIFSGSTDLSLIIASASTSGPQFWAVGSGGSFSIKVVNDTSVDAIGNYAVAVGSNTLAFGDSSFAEGNYTIAAGEDSHAQGYKSIAAGITSHAEGNNTIASGDSSHAEGYETTAYGLGAHAEGGSTQAIGNHSHVEGNTSIASGDSSHAGGYNSQAIGDASFVHGSGSTALGNNTVVFGNNITGINDNSVYVPYLNINLADTDNTLTTILVQDVTGDIRVRSLDNMLSSLSGDTFDGGTF